MASVLNIIHVVSFWSAKEWSSFEFCWYVLKSSNLGTLETKFISPRFRYFASFSLVQFFDPASSAIDMICPCLFSWLDWLLNSDGPGFIKSWVYMMYIFNFNGDSSCNSQYGCNIFTLDIQLLLADNIRLNKNDLLDVWPLLGGGGHSAPLDFYLDAQEGRLGGSWVGGRFVQNHSLLPLWMPFWSWEEEEEG